jgi:hypothetical protein
MFEIVWQVVKFWRGRANCSRETTREGSFNTNFEKDSPRREETLRPLLQYPLFFSDLEEGAKRKRFW